MKSLLATPVGKHQEGVNFLDVGRLKKIESPKKAKLFFLQNLSMLVGKNLFFNDLHY